MVVWQKTAGSSLMYNAIETSLVYGRRQQDAASYIMVEVPMVV